MTVAVARIRSVPAGRFTASIAVPQVFQNPVPGKFTVTVDLTADLTVINPFDFFVEPYAERFPFAYPPDTARDLLER